MSEWRTALAADDDAALLEIIADLEDCTEAEAMLAGIHCSGRTKLTLQRRFAELIEAAGTGWSGDRRNQCRKVGAVDRDVFELYIATECKHTLSGLLHYAQPAEERDLQERLAKEQLEWVVSDAGRRWTQGNLYEFDGKLTPAQAKRGSPHGPIVDKKVVKAFDDLIIEVRADRNARAKMNARSGSKRLREAKSGRQLSTVTELARMQLEIAQQCVVLQDFDIECYDLSDQPALWRATDILDDLIHLSEWTDRTITSIQARASHQDVRERIAKLRDTTGRTPPERDTALRLADRLEHKINNGLTA